MTKAGFITNKYVISILVLLCLLFADILLHRSMSRVILPSDFSTKIKAVQLPVCHATLDSINKHWTGDISSVSQAAQIPADIKGIECNVYFDTADDHFKTGTLSANNGTNIDSLLQGFTGYAVWFECENLSLATCHAAMQEMIRIRKEYRLQNRMIIESTDARCLKQLCDSGFFSSYRVPMINPYQSSEAELIRFTDSIKHHLMLNPVSALSCYYFQYPILKKFFPGYPILTRADNTSISLVSYVFMKQLEHDNNIKVILSGFND